MFDYYNSSEFANLEGTEENCEELLSSHKDLQLPIDTATDGSVIEGEGTYAYLFFNAPPHQLESKVYGGGKESTPTWWRKPLKFRVQPFPRRDYEELSTENLDLWEKVYFDGYSGQKSLGITIGGATQASCLYVPRPTPSGSTSLAQPSTSR